MPSLIKLDLRAYGRIVDPIYIQIRHLFFIAGKEDKDCMYEQSSLGMFVFDENRLLAVHDYERNFPAVIDIYSFW